jgi:hypothetical protein
MVATVARRKKLKINTRTAARPAIDIHRLIMLAVLVANPPGHIRHDRWNVPRRRRLLAHAAAQVFDRIAEVNSR